MYNTNVPIVIDENLLPEQTLKEIYSLSEELSKAYNTRQIFRTETEARISVLDDVHFPTKASKYWQSVREQTVMLEQLTYLSYEYRRNEVSIKRFTRDINNKTDELDIEEAQINLDEALFKKANIKQTAIDRAREIKMWSKIKAELDDGSFDTQDVNTHQLISYTTQFALKAGMINKDQLSGDEYNNLVGHLQTSLKRCNELGVLDKVLENLPSELKVLITQQQ